MYTLAGLDNRAMGWGIEGETFAWPGGSSRYGEETWFQPRRPRHCHPHRPHARGCAAAGASPPSCVTSSCRSASGPTILPMTDETGPDGVRTDDGWLEFQEYFVHRHQEPVVHEVRFEGIEAASMTP